MSDFKNKFTINSANFLYSTLIAFLGKANVRTLSNLICKTFAKLLKTQEAALFLKQRHNYKIRGAFSLRKKRIQTTCLGLKSPFVERLKNIKKTIVFKKQGDFSLEEFKIFYFKHTLSRLAVDYVIPLRHKKEFIGFLILGKAYKESIDIDPEANVRDKIDLIKYLVQQAALCLEYALLRERLAISQNKFRQANQIKNCLWQYFDSGIIFIDYSTERILSVNKKLREIFKIENFSPVNKKIDSLIHRYSTSYLANFLKSYKKAKVLRRSFRKDLFTKQAIKIKGRKFILNSNFIRGTKKMSGDLILIKSIGLTKKCSE